MVDTFVMEMLVVMVTSLRLAHADNRLQGAYVCMYVCMCVCVFMYVCVCIFIGTQDKACQAIDHVTRIMCVKAPKLNTPSKTRRVPK